MPEQIERVLKAIHVLFSKSDIYMNAPDKIILNKREMFDLLEQLNYAVMGVMEEHEATLQARERARKVLEQEQQAMIDQTEGQAEEIYAAAMLYTDGALNDAQAVMEQTRAQLQADFQAFDEQMELRFAQLRENQTAIAEQLSVLRAHQTYLELIKQQEAKQLSSAALADAAVEEDARKEQAGRPAAKNGRRKKQAGAKKQEQADAQGDAVQAGQDGQTDTLAGMQGSFPQASPVLAGQESDAAMPSQAEEALPAADLPDALWAEEDEEPPRQKIEIKVHVRQPGEDNIFAREPKKREKGQPEAGGQESLQIPAAALSAEGEVSEAAYYRAEDFNLDAEYEQWRNAQEGKDTAKPEGGKRHFLFGRRK